MNDTIEEYPPGVAILKRAMSLISNPAQWTKFTFSRDKNGNSVSSHTSGACQWCVMGAINRASHDLDMARTPDDPYAARRLINKSIPRDFVGVTATSFNDDSATHHQDIMHLFERAIKEGGGFVQETVQ